MDLYFNTQTIIIIIVAIVAIFILFKIFKKVVRTVLILIIILGLGYYVLVFSNIFKDPNTHSKYSIDYIKEKFCTDMVDHSDSVKCYMIITPIYDDMKASYTEEELLELEKNPAQYFKALNIVVKRNKKDILKNLAKNKQEDIWNSFIDDLKHKYPQQQIAQ